MVFRLAQDLTIDHDDCVRAQHVALRIARRNGLRFLARQADCIFARIFAGDLIFIDVGRMHLKCDPGLA